MRRHPARIRRPAQLQHANFVTYLRPKNKKRRHLFSEAHHNILIYLFKLERATRIERATLTLARLCSTPELRPRSKLGGGYGKAVGKMQGGRRASL